MSENCYRGRAGLDEVVEAAGVHCAGWWRGAAWPGAVGAQQGGRMRRIGVLIALGAADPEAKAHVAAFRDGLAQLGWRHAPFHKRPIARETGCSSDRTPLSVDMRPGVLNPALARSSTGPFG